MISVWCHTGILPCLSYKEKKNPNINLWTGVSAPPVWPRVTQYPSTLRILHNMYSSVEWHQFLHISFSDLHVLAPEGTIERNLCLGAFVVTVPSARNAIHPHMFLYTHTHTHAAFKSQLQWHPPLEPSLTMLTRQLLSFQQPQPLPPLFLSIVLITA